MYLAKPLCVSTNATKMISKIEEEKCQVTQSSGIRTLKIRFKLCYLVFFRRTKGKHLTISDSIETGTGCRHIMLIIYF